MKIKGRQVPDEFRENAIRQEALGLILKAAEAGQTVNYSDIMEACELPRGRKLAIAVGVLGEWSHSEWAGVYFSVIVVQKSGKEKGFPYGGFFGAPGLPAAFHRGPSEWGRSLSATDKEFIRECQAKVFAWAKRGSRTATAAK